jgi:hypothetical protein
MRLTKKFLLMLLGFSLFGCSSYVPTALAPNHPAHPDAAVGMAGPRSKTLAYAAADLPSQAKPVGAADEERTGDDAHSNAQGATQRLASGEGKVIAVVPGAQWFYVYSSSAVAFIPSTAPFVRRMIGRGVLVSGLRVGVTLRQYDSTSEAGDAEAKHLSA